MLVMRLFPRAACTLDSWHPELKSVRDLATYLKPDHPFWACRCALTGWGCPKHSRRAPASLSSSETPHSPGPGVCSPHRPFCLPFPLGGLTLAGTWHFHVSSVPSRSVSHLAAPEPSFHAASAPSTRHLAPGLPRL